MKAKSCHKKYCTKKVPAPPPPPPLDYVNPTEGLTNIYKVFSNPDSYSKNPQAYNETAKKLIEMSK